MKKVISTGLMLLLISGLIPGETDAQPSYFYQYAVKFIYGKSDGKSLTPGEYYTAINVHHPTDTTVVFRKKIAVALSGENSGSISGFMKHPLDIDQAMKISCRDIYKQDGSGSEFLTGFVVIESHLEIDVIAVYTGTGSSGEVEILDIETVLPRSLAECPDLVVTKIEKPVWRINWMNPQTNTQNYKP